MSRTISSKSVGDRVVSISISSPGGDTMSNDGRFTKAEALAEARTLIRLLGFSIATEAMDARCADLRDRMQGNWYLDMRDVRAAMDVARRGGE